METVTDGLAGKEERLGEVIAAYLEAVDAGWAPPREDVLASYPDLSADLSAFFVCQDEISRLAFPAAPVPPPARPPTESTGRRAETRDGRRSEELTTAALRPAAPSAASPADGLRAVGDYDLLGEIRRGGMGVVYKARQRSLNRVVALKMMRAGPWATPAEVQRFRNEAEDAANLDHPNIVPIYEVGEFLGLVYFSMKLFEGGSLTDQLDRFTSDPRAAARLLATVARAVHHAHQRGLLHRDLKPGNILLDKDGQPHVSDFGLAKRLTPAPAEAALPAAPAPPQGVNGLTLSAPPEAGLTEAGAVVGTPGYMAPEQAEGQKSLTTAADVYGLGAVLYKVLTGKPPFEGATPEEVRRRVAAGNPRSPRALNPRVDKRLEAVCLKCLQKDPARRYASAQALAEDLERWLAGEPPLAWPLPWPRRAWRAARRHLAVSAAVAVCAFALALALAAAYFDPDRPLHAIEARLAEGKPATLIAALGPPAWYRWSQGADATKLTLAADQPFALETLAGGQLKLLPDPKTNCYRFRAEVCHVQAMDVSEVGLFFGFHTAPTATGVAHFWCALTFADRGINARAHWPKGQELKGPPSYSRLGLTAHRLTEPNGDHRPMPAKVSLTFPPPAHGQPAPWRKLAVEVTPKAIRVLWEEKMIPDGEISVDRLTTHVNNTYKLIGQGKPGPLFQFNPRGALGLVVSRGKAAFRNVAVEPLR